MRFNHFIVIAISNKELVFHPSEAGETCRDGALPIYLNNISQG